MDGNQNKPIPTDKAATIIIKWAFYLCVRYAGGGCCLHGFYDVCWLQREVTVAG